jgi:predicted SAM-dependent methyltransferase
MSNLTTLAKMHFRRMFAAAGIHVIKSKYSRWQAELYDESERPKQPKYVNLGAGAFYHPLWHNVDVPNDYYSTQQGNLHVAHDFTKREPLPFASASVKVFYCSHLIEHLSNEDAQRLFKEVHRCLVPGGVFRLTCPDMELQYFAYRRSDAALWGTTSPWRTQPKDLEQRFLEHFATALSETHVYLGVPTLSSSAMRRMFEELDMDSFFESIVAMLPSDINARMPEGHCNWFSPAKLNAMLGTAGFPEILHSRYLQSIEPKLRDPRLFDGTCPDISLYIDCVK